MSTDTVCPTRSELIDYSYGELETDEWDRIQMHLETCASCASLQEGIERTLSLASELEGGPVTPSPKVEAALRAMVAARKPVWSRVWDRVGGAAVLQVPAWQALLGGLVLGVMVQVGMVVSTDEGVSPTEVRPPTSGASVIRIQPVSHETTPVPRFEGLENTVDAVSQDQYAQIF